MTKIVPKSLYLLMMVSCFLIGAVPLPAQGYNSPGDTPNISLGGHAWMTNKAIEYLKVIAPDAYLLANQYREQLIDGAWYADHNSGTCNATAADPWPCDSTNHYEPQFSFHPVLGFGVRASVSASKYASDLFSVADNCWSSRDPASTLADWYLLPGGLHEGSLPNSCRVHQWRAIDDDYLTGFGEFSHDGPLMRIPPLSLLGWALHMVQDATQVYHTYSTPNNGHQESENYVDAFIQDPNNANTLDTLPFKNAEASLKVPTSVRCSRGICSTVVEAFVQDVASETRRIAEYRHLLTGITGHETLCCDIPKDQLKSFTESSLNRAINYAATLLSVYFRRHGAAELYNAVLIVVVD
jgi:hypothetical protein